MTDEKIDHLVNAPLASLRVLLAQLDWCVAGSDVEKMNGMLLLSLHPHLLQSCDIL